MARALPVPRRKRDIYRSRVGASGEGPALDGSKRLGRLAPVNRRSEYEGRAAPLVPRTESGTDAALCVLCCYPTALEPVAGFDNKVVLHSSLPTESHEKRTILGWNDPNFLASNG